MQEHEAQRPMLEEIRGVIEESNAKSTASSDISGQHTNKQVFGNGNIRSFSVSEEPTNKQDYGNGNIRSLSVSQSSDIKRGIPQSQTRSNLASQGRPVDELHFNTSISNGLPSSPAPDPLVARFSQLRTTQAPMQKKLPYPVDDDFAYLSPTEPNKIKSLSPSQSQFNITLKNDKLSGPKPHSKSSSSLPPHPPKLPINSRIVTSLPRAPSPIYSPARNIAAPSSIEPPRTTARSTAGLVGKTPKSPPNGMVLANGHERPDSPARSRPPELPRSSRVTAQELSGLFRYYDILVIDVRARDLFDEGHIFHKSIVCIEPLSLQYGTSFESLLDRMIVGPESELQLLNRIHAYDMVVYYDQNTTSDRFLQSSPKATDTPSLRALHDSLTEFNYNNTLKRAPVVLVGGLDAWIDLVGPQALQSSRTLDMPRSQRLAKPPRRPPHRLSVTGGNSSQDVRMRRLRDYQPLNAEEEKTWREKARNEEVEPANIRDFQPDSIDESQSFRPVHDINEFLRRFPEATAVPTSMISPRQDLPSPRRQPISGTPLRPPPTVSRPSYSGVSEHDGSQVIPSSRQAISAQPPLYISKEFYSLKLPRTGLTNMGQTCYMNATIQCLVATVPISKLFLQPTWRNFVQNNKMGSRGVMPEHFSNLIRRIWQPDPSTFRPATFRSLCGQLREEWGSNRQQDAQEFFQWLTDILHEDLNTHYKRNNVRALTPEEEQFRERLPISEVSRIEWERWSHKNSSEVSTLFAGQHRSSLRCDTCGNKSTTYETFYSITVEIPLTGTGNLADCLRSYCQEETLADRDEWYCPNCKCHREATKRLTITRLPQVLVIHFKRFAFSDQRSNADKLSTPIDFPLHGLDMAPYMASTRTQVQAGGSDISDFAVTPPFVFDAYAVMQHKGKTMESGHYVAMVKDSLRNTWVSFDDERVHNFDPAKLPHERRLQNSEAYLVFYERARAR